MNRDGKVFANEFELKVLIARFFCEEESKSFQFFVRKWKKKLYPRGRSIQHFIIMLFPIAPQKFIWY